MGVPEPPPICRPSHCGHGGSASASSITLRAPRSGVEPSLLVLAGRQASLSPWLVSPPSDWELLIRIRTISPTSWGLPEGGCHVPPQDWKDPETKDFTSRPQTGSLLRQEAASALLD